MEKFSILYTYYIWYGFGKFASNVESQYKFKNESVVDIFPIIIYSNIFKSRNDKI